MLYILYNIVMDYIVIFNFVIFNFIVIDSYSDSYIMINIVIVI